MSLGVASLSKEAHFFIIILGVAKAYTMRPRLIAGIAAREVGFVSFATFGVVVEAEDHRLDGLEHGRILPNTGDDLG